MQQLLRLLADPTRVRILAAVEREELGVSEIADVLAMGQSRISNHLRLLRDGNALHGRREGAWTFYRNALEDNALWEAVRNGMKSDASLKADRVRRRGVLDRRRRRSREHFAAGDGNGVALERGSLREELLAALAPDDWAVVDAGCGDGFLTELLGRRFESVRAFDHSPERLAAARKRLKGAPVTLETGEVDDLPLAASSVDALFFSMVLHHVPEIGAALKEAHRVLRPGGRIVVADLAPHQQEAMRERMGDLRLGLDGELLVQDMRDAGFERVRLLEARDRLVVGRHRCLDLFLAAGRRPAKGKPKRRRQ